MDTKTLTDEERRAEAQRYRDLTGGELAREVMDLIEDNRDRWYQGSWRQDVSGAGPCDGAPDGTLEAFAEDPLNPACTTSFCYAGWVGAIKGVKWMKGDQENIGNPETCDCVGLCCVNVAHQLHIGVYARGVLGLDEYDGDKLFNGDNDIHTLRAYTDQIVASGGITRYLDDEDEDDDA